ncbi:hypothetical protein [Cytobacillus dafuensis]|uniref:hypothetical protein n=1 Tax=Cytobacillus dafuensis TaxID=1742359 RepID=UPI001E3BDB31|nr:hypothetical protein [Cytobacillus dafuensis]
MNAKIPLLALSMLLIVLYQKFTPNQSITSIIIHLKEHIRNGERSILLFKTLKRMCIKLNKWIKILLSTRILQNMFGRRRNNRGMIWASLLGLGVSAAAIGLSRNRNRNMMNPLQNIMNNLQTPLNRQVPNAALTEFAKEIIPDKNSLTNK